ncbi:MAG: hypothetical protein JM58_07555 [Peptococcaceae bacterium BICA1-8]|nr:MAG: hypothetical protein JM58_07555 [Peptococcaceae bacterium BICA1-8]
MYKWVEIDLDAIESNFLKIREMVRPETKVLGVVKADAYGHGIIEVSRALVHSGVDFLGVTEIAEGIKLREAGIKTPVLVFGPFLPEDAFYFQEFDLTATLSDLNSIRNIVTQGFRITAHLKIETGLGRTGFKYTELAELAQILNNNDNILIEGIYSHLATSMSPDSSFSYKQFENFTEAIKFFEKEGFKIPIKHICNSAALVKFPQMHLDMVRAGTILYGQEVAGNLSLQGGQKNAWYLKGQITYINDLPKGHSIGYERSHFLKAAAKTAVVPIGFHHGFSVEPIPRPKGLLDLIKVLAKVLLRFIDHPRMKTYVRIRDKEVPVIGKVGMQMTILDVTSIPDLIIGETVEMPGRRTNISLDLPKVYLREGKPIKIRKISEKYEEFLNNLSD